MDVLTDVLSVTGLSNTVLGHAELLRPWGLEVGSRAKAAVHYVERGTCWLRIGGAGRPVRLVTGDLVLVGRGVRHILSDEPATAASPFPEVLERMQRRLSSASSSRRSSADALLCAEYEFEDEGPHALLDLLPRAIHLRACEVREAPSLVALLGLLAREGTHSLPGHDLVVPRLIDTLLVFIVRRWLEAQPAGGAGWFGALRDPQIGRVLGLIHNQPEHPWTLIELAQRAFQSRATFARRFRTLVGEPPLTYLTRWRMRVAMKLLTMTSDSLDLIAARTGYDSGMSLSKAFRRHTGVAPGRYRAAKNAERFGWRSQRP